MASALLYTAMGGLDSSELVSEGARAFLFPLSKHTLHGKMACR